MPVCRAELFANNDRTEKLRMEIYPGGNVRIFADGKNSGVTVLIADIDDYQLVELGKRMVRAARANIRARARLTLPEQPKEKEGA